MHSNGVPEEYITGDEPDDASRSLQKHWKWPSATRCTPGATWNWKKHFGYNGVLNGDTAEEVWNLCNDKLQHDPKMTVRGLIEQSNVAMVGTTDDPIDSLEWHEKIKEDPTIKVVVAPSFRPDKVLNIRKDSFRIRSISWKKLLAASSPAPTVWSTLWKSACSSLLR